MRLDNPQGTSGVLLGMRCLDCSVYVFGQAVFCQACTSDNLESVDLSRQGTLYSYTIVRVPPEGWPGPVPYVLGEVELPEGPHVLAEVVGVEDSDLRIGLDVELALREVQAQGLDLSRVVYKWTPAGTVKAISGEAQP